MTHLTITNQLSTIARTLFVSLVLLCVGISPVLATPGDDSPYCNNWSTYARVLEKGKGHTGRGLKRTLARALASGKGKLGKPQYQRDLKGIKASPEGWQREVREQLHACRKYYALVIGINDYKDDNIKDLKMAVNDAKAVAEVLEKDYGFQVTTLLNEEATFFGILSAYEELAEKTSEHDSVLVYFSGHGYYDKRRDKAYWLPVDAARYKFTWIMADSITSTMKSSYAKKILVVADSCYSGMLTRDVGGGQSQSHARMVERMWQDNSRVLITSGGNEPVLDAGGKGHSIFAQAFLDKLRQIPDPAFTASRLSYQLRERVAGNAEQIPEYHILRNSGHDGGDFVFRRLGPKSPSTVSRDKPSDPLASSSPSTVSDAKPSSSPSTVSDEKPSFSLASSSPGTVFRDKLKDGGFGPEMVVVPAGRFKMGDIQGGGDDDEQPVHEVSIQRFAMTRHEVTVSEFKQFVETSGYKTEAEKGKGCRVYKSGSWQWVEDANWRNPNFSQENHHPVVCVSWNDATFYAKWLSKQTGQTYRLPTEAEWEYAARAGTETKRYWGNEPDNACHYANVHDKTSKQVNGFSWTHHDCTDGYAQTAPVGSFKPNAFNLFDMLGNVWEWTCSRYEERYTGTETKCISQTGGRLALRGGAWGDGPRYVRTAYRGRDSRGNRYVGLGFRLARPK